MAAWDTIDRYLIISADTHAGADLLDYKSYLAREWHEEFDEWARTFDTPFDDLQHHTAMRNWDSDFRLSELDADGITAELIISNTVPPFFPINALIIMGLPENGPEFERRWAGVQAHNRWVVDFVAEAPTRRRGAVQIFPNDIDRALAEINWAYETGAFGGVHFVQPPPGHEIPPLFHLRYEPLWALCAEMDLPLVSHNATPPNQPMDQPASKAVYPAKSYLWNQSTLIDLILGGVFERHPTLKWVPTESGFLWPMEVGRRLDPLVRGMKATADNRSLTLFGDDTIDELSLTPSEYVKRNVYYGSGGHTVTPPAVERRYDVGVDHIMWGNDYPHEEGSTPQSLLALRWAFADVPEAECRQMFGGTAASLYGFDLDALVPVAERVGPRVSDVHTPVTAADLRDDEIEQSREAWERPFAGGALLTRQRPADSTFGQ